MKAHFSFIGNNKMKADFCFIESADNMVETHDHTGDFKEW
jgi:hypothetical protein